MQIMAASKWDVMNKNLPVVFDRVKWQRTDALVIVSVGHLLT